MPILFPDLPVYNDQQVAQAPRQHLLAEYLLPGRRRRHNQQGTEEMSTDQMTHSDPKKSAAPINLTPPALWRENKDAQNSPGTIGGFDVTEYQAPNSPGTKLCQWNRSPDEFPLSHDSARRFQQILKKDPREELKGARMEKELAEVLSNGVYDNEGNFTTRSLHTQMIAGKKVLVLEADWKDAEPPKRSYGIFVDASGDGKHIQQIWFIAPAGKNRVAGEYEKYLPEAKRAIESLKLK